MKKKLLTIAGSDCSGGAGIQADIKTFSALGTYAMSVICSVTAQNTTGVFGVHDIPPDMVRAQIDAVFEDIQVDGVKIGMVSNKEIIDVIVDRLSYYKPKIIVLDPVMVSTSGSRLINEDAIESMITKLLPLATVVTPNIPEAEVIAGIPVGEDDAALQSALYKIGDRCENVLIKGGHRKREPIDTLLYQGEIYQFAAERVKTKHTHGTGCTLSSAIASFLALGDTLDMAVVHAKDYVTRALENSYSVGHGHGPVNHFWRKD